MPTDLSDIHNPTECREMSHADARLAINTSGGKNSQAMTVVLSNVPPDQVAIRFRAFLPEWVPEHGEERVASTADILSRLGGQ